MTLLADCLTKIILPPRETPFTIPWPASGMPGAFLAFERVQDWRVFVLGLDLLPHIPLTVRTKFARALSLLYLAWMEFDLVKAAELVAMTTLQLALTDRHLGGGKPPAFGKLFEALVLKDALTDAQIPMIARCGGTVVGRISGEARPTLRAIRNALAHDDPFSGTPYAGLIELIRDLIAFAYRNYLAEANQQGMPA